MIILNNIYSLSLHSQVNFMLPLTAEQRRRSHQRIELDHENIFYLKLPRGTKLEIGNILQSEDKLILAKIEAKPEPVMTVTANSYLDLLKASYHLGNRHIPLEIKDNYLRFNQDHVLAKMLVQMGLNVKSEICPFYPEIGAYHHHG